MRKSILIVALSALVFTTGCVTKAKHNTVTSELEECRTDKLAAQDAASFCERRYSKEIERWDSIQAVVEEAIPQTIREFEAERDRIVALVPDQVQQEVSDYLSDFAQAVARGFSSLQGQNEQILAELQLYKSSLDEVGVRSKSIDETVTSQLQDSVARAQNAEMARRQATVRVADAVAGLIAEIQKFDQTYVSDRDSGERLRLNRNERETITLFHDGVVGRLVDLRDAADGG